MDLDIVQLRESAKILHLLFHRNKNQHRQATWWKWLSMLRRCLEKWIIELEVFDSVKTPTRTRFMAGYLLPRCYRSFSQLVQDNQFCTLGLVLLAELARIRRLIGAETDRSADLPESVAQDHPLSPISQPPRPIEDLGEAVERDLSVRLPSTTSSTNGEPMPLHQSNDEDLSNALKVSIPRSQMTDTSEATEKVPKLSKSKSTKRKKKRGGTVIDDLFRGL